MSLVFAMLLAVQALANPRQVVEEIFAKAAMSDIAQSTVKQNEVNDLVDFSALAKSALSKEAKSLSAADQKWFSDTLKEIITRTVYPKAPEFLSGVIIQYEDTQEKIGKATVKSTVQNKADTTDVHYVLARSKDGNWKVVDVSIAGISWVESIRDQVKDTIKSKKWKGLKEAMTKRVSDLRSGKI